MRQRRTSSAARSRGNSRACAPAIATKRTPSAAVAAGVVAAAAASKRKRSAGSPELVLGGREAPLFLTSTRSRHRRRIPLSSPFDACARSDGAVENWSDGHPPTRVTAYTTPPLHHSTCDASRFATERRFTPSSTRSTLYDARYRLRHSRTESALPG